MRFSNLYESLNPLCYHQDSQSLDVILDAMKRFKVKEDHRGAMIDQWLTLVIDMLTLVKDMFGN